MQPPRQGIWQGSTGRLVITQNANLTLRFPLTPTAALVQSVSFFADPNNTDPIALGTSAVQLPGVGIAGQAYGVLGPGQMGRAYTTDENDFFDLGNFWVSQNHPTNTNLFYYTVWKRTV
jgi:hypothetical protein